MNRERNFTRTLPEEYRLVREIDAAGNKKFVLWLNVAGTALMAAVFFIAVWLRFGGFSWRLFVSPQADSLPEAELPLLVLLVCMALYMVLHELLHGLVYKVMTGEKLTFGLTLSCAYCGVPNIYVTRKTALRSLLAPFTVFTVVLVILIAVLPDRWALIATGLLAVHIGGCIGDLYDTAVLLFSLRGDILMRDTGPKQSFYRKEH